MAKTIFEEFKVTGGKLLSRINELIKKGNIRRIIIKDSKGRTLLETPLTFGVAGLGGLFVLAPFLTAVGTIAVFVSDISVIVERYTDENPDENEINQEYVEIEVEDEKQEKKKE